MDAERIIAEYGVIPIIGLKDPSAAPDLAEALKRGGLPLIEVTLRNQNALECLKAIKQSRPSMLVGAGTVLNCEQVDEALDAGADFVVSPGFNSHVVEYCLKKGLPITPGCVTPSEIENGLELGLKTFKFFPSEALGGADTVRQLCGPYKNIKFICTGGVGFENAEKYLSYSKIAAVGGSFVAPAAMIDAKDWEGISRLCRKAVDLSLGFSLAHIGLNGTGREDGLSTAAWFADRFGFPVAEGGKSNFAGSGLECGNMKFPGQNGHIGIFTNSTLRAEAYFQRKGIKLREEFRNVNANGELVAVYLADEIKGFAVHVVRKGND
jgi:2-dehydro-3-deoxyphosphogluconate aldolase/(4S)-4-hydroxy-2-oxoglutarate aldolase